MLTFSGSADGPKKAMQLLQLKFGTPHLQIPAVYDEIKAIKQANAQHEIPKTAKRILAKLESVSSLHHNDEVSLPAEVTTAIFKALHQHKRRKKILPL